MSTSVSDIWKGVILRINAITLPPDPYFATHDVSEPVYVVYVV